MAGHRPSDLALLGSGEAEPGGPEPGRIHTPIWFSAQGPRSRLMVLPGARPGICPGREVWGVEGGG